MEEKDLELNKALNIFLYSKKLNIKKICKNGKVNI